jgi:hypothetical protein
VLAHADDDERRRRGVGNQVSQCDDAVGSEDRLIDDHHRRGDALQLPSQIGQVGDRRQRLDAGIALEQTPQRPADAPVRGGEEDRDGGSYRGGLRRHLPTSIARRRPALIRGGPEPASVGHT